MLEESDTYVSINVLLSNIPHKKTQMKYDNKIITNFLNMHNDSYIIYTYENPIEWTPIKLYQYVYFLLRTNNEFWIIKYSKLEGLQYNYITNLQDLLISKIYSFINFNTKAPVYLINMYFHNIKKNSNGSYAYLCTTNDNINKYDNYIIKWNDKIHYVQLIY